jgi:hypothetical protein
LQRRHAELGRIRLGKKGDKGQPQKLDRFRFTSPLERHIRDLATLYGGTPQEWKNGTATEWEVYSTANSIPVVVVKGGLSQWMETWSGGGCVHRCDGVTNALTGDLCNPEDPAHQNAKPTTRLSVMLPELEAIGVWRTETHGWNAAATLPNMHDLAAYLGDLVPARLMLKEQKTVKDGRTNRFVVPVLDLEVSASRLTALVQQANGGQIGAIEQQSEAKAIESAADTDWITEALAQCQTADDVRDLWQRVNFAHAMNPDLAAVLTARGEELKAAVDGTVDPDMSVDDAWSAMVAEAGKHNLTASAIDFELTTRYAPLTPDQLTALQLVEFTADLKAGKVAA